MAGKHHQSVKSLSRVGPSRPTGQVNLTFIAIFDWLAQRRREGRETTSTDGETGDMRSRRDGETMDKGRAEKWRGGGVTMEIIVVQGGERKEDVAD